MLGSLIFTAVGSAICGAAPSMNVLIAGRSEFFSSLSGNRLFRGLCYLFIL